VLCPPQVALDRGPLFAAGLRPQRDRLHRTSAILPPITASYPAGVYPWARADFESDGEHPSPWYSLARADLPRLCAVSPRHDDRTLSGRARPRRSHCDARTRIGARRAGPFSTDLTFADRARHVIGVPLGARSTAVALGLSDLRSNPRRCEGYFARAVLLGNRRSSTACLVARSRRPASLLHRGLVGPIRLQFAALLRSIRDRAGAETASHREVALQCVPDRQTGARGVARCAALRHVAFVARPTVGPDGLCAGVRADPAAPERALANGVASQGRPRQVRDLDLALLCLLGLHGVAAVPRCGWYRTRQPRFSTSGSHNSRVAGKGARLRHRPRPSEGQPGFCPGPAQQRG
jgi:hypothetical protein